MGKEIKESTFDTLKEPVKKDILAAIFTAVGETLTLGQALNEKGEITEEDIADITIDDFTYENASKEVKGAVDAILDFLGQGVSASGNLEVVFTDAQGNETSQDIVSINPFDLVVGSFEKEEGTRTVKFTADLPDSGRGEFSVSLRAITTSTTNKALGGAKSTLEASLQEIAVTFLDGQTYQAANEVELTPTSALPVEEDGFNSRQALIVDTFGGGNPESVIGKVFTRYNTAVNNIQSQIDNVLNRPIQPIVITPPDQLALNPALTPEQINAFEREGIARFESYLNNLGKGLDRFQGNFRGQLNLNQIDSQIRDADFARETQQFTRTQLLQQGSLNLANASVRNQNIISLL